jgi:DNA-binding response OmpR family regulator
MSRWTCPRCEREFGKANQAHVCVPGNTVERTFAGRPPVQREIYASIIAYLRSLGPVHEDAVRVGVFLKHESKLAEVRPMARALSLNLVLPRHMDSPRVLRRLRMTAERTVHVIRLTAVTDVDDEVREWLTEAYISAS